MTSLRQILVRWLPVCSPWLLAGYWAVLFTATHTPMPAGPPASDKLLHFSAYFVLAVLFAVWRITRHAPTRRIVQLTIGVLFAFAVFDELTQTLVGRHCDALDAAADWAGISAALACVLPLRSWLEPQAGAERPFDAEPPT